MKRYIPYFLIAALMILFAPAELSAAKKKYSGEVTFSNLVKNRTDEGMMEISVTADFGKLNLKRQQAVVLTPALAIEGAEEQYIYEFAPVAVAGSARYKAINREIGLGNLTFSRTPEKVIKYSGKKNTSYEFNLSVPYEPWMDNARVIVAEEVSGCAGCRIARNEYSVEPEEVPIYIPIERPVVHGFTPNFRLSLVVPPQDTVKRRAETYSAWLNFEVGKSELRRDIGRNAQMLNDVDKTLTRLLNDRNVGSITISVKGYASPEGGQSRNKTLSHNRALSFVNYLSSRHGFSRDMINFSSYGEDWAGLRTMVERSEMASRQAVLNIIDGTGSISERKARLQALNGGSTYEYMLHNLYPTLRRNEYTISYTVKAFDLQEAKEILKTNPTQLSLYEMYKVASSYEKESYEFREVFDTAARVYPTDPIANINASALDIVIEADDVAISRIYTLNKPEAWNNLAIAYFKKGFYELAEEFFLKAVEAGDDNAIYNYSQFQQWKESGGMKTAQ